MSHKSNTQVSKLNEKVTDGSMETNTRHYISSPDGHRTGSENEIIKKIRRKYKKIQEVGDLWYHTSDEEMELQLEMIQPKVP